MNKNLSGNLIIIGGAEDKKGKKEILKTVCNNINKDKDILLVATIATEYPKEAATRYRKVFSELGVNNIKILDISNRNEAFKEENSKLIKEASLIVHIIDASSPYLELQVETTNQVLNELGVQDIPTIYVFNKRDTPE